jgi:hypothetical protein
LDGRHTSATDSRPRPSPPSIGHHWGRPGSLVLRSLQPSDDGRTREPSIRAGSLWTRQRCRTPCRILGSQPHYALCAYCSRSPVWVDGLRCCVLRASAPAQPAAGDTRRQDASRRSKGWHRTPPLIPLCRVLTRTGKSMHPVVGDASRLFPSRSGPKRTDGFLMDVLLEEDGQSGIEILKKLLVVSVTNRQSESSYGILHVDRLHAGLGHGLEVAVLVALPA